MKPDTTITEAESIFGVNIERLYPFKSYREAPKEFQVFH
jgi:hypothetical protein